MISKKEELKNKIFVVISILAFFSFFVFFKPVFAQYLSPTLNPPEGNVFPSLYNVETLLPEVNAIVERNISVMGDTNSLGDIDIDGLYSINSDSSIGDILSVIGDSTVANAVSRGFLNSVNTIMGSEICNVSGSVCRNLSDSWAGSTASAETDPTVPVYLKDGFGWSEILSLDILQPTLADGIDNVGIPTVYLDNNESTGNFKLGLSSINLNSGQSNTAVGGSNLNNNSGSYNTAVGFDALRNNTVGSNNMAIGNWALLNNQTGEQNVAIGRETLRNNTASRNTALGHYALANNTSGADNVGFGPSSLSSNIGGSFNTVVGREAMYSATNNSGNTVVGERAFYSGTGDYNVIIGRNAGTSYSGNNQLFFGSSFAGPALMNGFFVSKLLYVAAIMAHSSDERLKKDVKNIYSSLDKIKQLQGVEFYWIETGKKDLGFIAQDFEKVFPDLVVTDESTPEKYKSIAYENLVSPVIEAVKEQQKQIDEQDFLLEDIASQVEKLKIEMKK